MHEIASRFATQAALPLVFDSTEPQVIEAGLQHSGGKAILNSANLEDGEDAGQAIRPRHVAGPRVRRSGDLPRASTRRARRATRTGSCASAGASTTSPSSATASNPPTCSSTCSRSRSAPGQEDLRRDGIETIEAIRRVKAELPGASTMLGLSNISFGSEARDPPRAEQRVPARVPRGRPRRRDRARGPDHADAQDRRSAPASSRST